MPLGVHVSVCGGMEDVGQVMSVLLFSRKMQSHWTAHVSQHEQGCNIILEHMNIKFATQNQNIKKTEITFYEIKQ